MHVCVCVPYPSQVSEAIQGGDTRPLANQFLPTVNLLHLVRTGGAAEELQLVAAAVGEDVAQRLDRRVAEATSLQLQG